MRLREETSDYVLLCSAYADNDGGLAVQPLSIMDGTLFRSVLSLIFSEMASPDGLPLPAPTLTHASLPCTHPVAATSAGTPLPCEVEQPAKFSTVTTRNVPLSIQSGRRISVGPQGLKKLLQQWFDLWVIHVRSATEGHRSRTKAKRKISPIPTGRTFILSARL
jgi:hypothetical protein